MRETCSRQCGRTRLRYLYQSDVVAEQKLKVLLRPEDILIEELDETKVQKRLLVTWQINYKGMTLRIKHHARP